MLTKYIEELTLKKNLIVFKETELEKARTNINKLEGEVENLIDSINLSENAILGTKMLLEKVLQDSKTSLEMFLTYALNQIFTDKSYEIKFNIKEEVKNPSLEIMLVEDGIEQEITNAVGGGILSTLGLLLQIYYIEVYDLNKTMFIDEGLKEVSKGNGTESSVNYLQNVLMFLKYLSDHKGYKFIIVTHDNFVKDFADTIYVVEKGKVSKQWQ